MFYNNAKACQDRIIPNLLSLCGQQLFLPAQSMELHTEVLLRSRYHLKSTLGLLDDYNSHSDENPIFGTGQGSTASPFVWAAISSLFVGIMRSGPAYPFATPNDKQLLHESRTASLMMLQHGRTSFLPLIGLTTTELSRPILNCRRWRKNGSNGLT
jgi:hypothetical protein